MAPRRGATSTAGPGPNTVSRNRIVYATVSTDPPMTPIPTMSCSGPSSLSTASMAASLAAKPSSGGAPAIDSPLATATANATGMERHSPPSCPISRVPVRMSISPTTRNRAALNRAWANNNDTAAKTALPVPTDRSVISRPSWEIVPHARMSLASLWRSAPTAPHRIDVTPKAIPSDLNAATSANAAPVTATSSTPAFTIVAEWR